MQNPVFSKKRYKKNFLIRFRVLKKTLFFDIFFPFLRNINKKRDFLEKKFEDIFYTKFIFSVEHPESKVLLIPYIPNME
jgi:hypothetical protein